MNYNDIEKIAERQAKEREEQDKQRRELLIKKCNEALNMQQFERKGVKTKCNLGAAWIANQIGSMTEVFYFIFRSSPGKLNIGSANMICNQAEKFAKMGKIKSVIKEQVQYYAWFGFPILACWKNPSPLKPGHVAIVYPDPQLLKVCNIGWNNGIFEPNDPKAFGNREIKYYKLPIILL